MSKDDAAMEPAGRAIAKGPSPARMDRKRGCALAAVQLPPGRAALLLFSAAAPCLLGPASISWADT